MARPGDWGEGSALSPIPEPAPERELPDCVGFVGLDGEEELAAVYTSDLRRAAETAEIVATALGLWVVPDPRLREIDVGSWQGRTRADLDGAPWDGESYDEHRARAVAALMSIAATHPGRRVLAVAHGGTLRRIQEAALGEAAPVVENCGVWAVGVEVGEFRALDRRPTYR